MKGYGLALLCSIGILFTQAQSLQSSAFEFGKLTKEEKMDWHNGHYRDDKVYGTGSNKAITELLKDKAPKRKTVVAIIDSGVEIDHDDLEGQLWTNEDEIPGNGLDDDQNGYVDDVHGWNFLVNAEGEDTQYDNLEATRVLRLSKQLEKAEQAYPDWLTKDVLTQAAAIYNETKSEGDGLKQFSEVWKVIDSTAQSVLQKEDYDMEELKAVDAGDNEDIKRAKRTFAIFRTLGISKADLAEMSDYYSKLEAYYLNFDFDAKAGFEPEDFSYGNNHYEGPDAAHGTHVAGIVAANRNNEAAARGVAGDAALIMALRTVPDGDERDRDVAAAIRYAADNGAHIINMSFGKGISPEKELVYEALDYAASKGLLLVHAAGNDAENVDETHNFPNNKGVMESTKRQYMTIGAIGPSKKGKKLVADFSNYGQTQVDIFAPGVDIYAPIPNNSYEFFSGTSMAAPTTSGAAALIWAYHPGLSAAELKALLIESGIDLGKKKVRLPGSKDKVKFATLSQSGKVISVYNAIKALENQGN
jgi:subtilisin family serine protease